MDLREPSQHDIAQSQVWKSTSGKHSPPSQRGKGNRRKGRRKRKPKERKPIQLSKDNMPALPKPPKKFWEDKETALRILVLTFNRADSLQRLLRSLREANYGENERIDLDIWIDKPEGNKPHDKETVSVAEHGEWKFGRRRVHLREENKGLAHQWINSWQDSMDPGIKWNQYSGINERAVMLEDDLVVSKFFWTYLKQCHDTYDSRPDFNGCTLQRASLCAENCPNLKGGPVEDGQVFFYPLVGSWGYSHTKTLYYVVFRL